MYSVLLVRIPLGLYALSTLLGCHGEAFGEEPCRHLHVRSEHHRRGAQVNHYTIVTVEKTIHKELLHV